MIRQDAAMPVSRFCQLTGALLRCEISGRAELGQFSSQIASASSVNAAATRSAGPDSTPSS
jgi:hypothetical protein